MGFDLVEWRLGGTKARPSLQLRIDRRDGATVKVDDCASASRAIESRLDLERPMGERYLLEVSSPGVERALKKVADWRRFVGRRATMTSAALGGRGEVEILDVEGDAGAERIAVRSADGREMSISLAEVKDARLAFHW
ncbi:MAG: ribosome maturation factor RimP [Gemmatimonadota bacterium]|nr:ribosome maturation factor RimP [Gemmatimonadota bacterium]